MYALFEQIFEKSIPSERNKLKHKTPSTQLRTYFFLSGTPPPALINSLKTLQNGLKRRETTKNSLFSRDVMYVAKYKIAEPLSFQLSLVIEHPKYISF